MKTSKILILMLSCLPLNLYSQEKMRLDEILVTITHANPVSKMYDYEIRSMDEAAKGAKSWMPAEFSTGLWMVPYNFSLWKKGEDGMTGMGQFMLSGQQMFPNVKKQDAEAAYMRAMSSVEKEKKNYALNQLYAEAKKNYYEWIVNEKKLAIIDQNEQLLQFMIKSAEIRYKNGLEKINAYYKAKAALGNLEKMRVMLEAEIARNKIVLNTLMLRDKKLNFSIDTTIVIKNYASYIIDSSRFTGTRSDLKAMDKEIELNVLKFNAEKLKSKPEFGIRYDHMFGFGGLPMQYSLMGMVKIPLNKKGLAMYRANTESIRWKNEALRQQRQMILIEAAGMADGMQQEWLARQRQLKLYEEKIIPALKTNYSAYQLAYEQNTEELFMLFDAWETLNMTQTEYLDILKEILTIQVELERILEIK